MNFFEPSLHVYHKFEDDPKKCTSSKLLRFGLLRNIYPRQFNNKCLVLNPFSSEVINPADHYLELRKIVVIDCSWKKINNTFNKKMRGINKRLPILVAGNPINYAKPSALSSVEALSACLIIIGYDDHAKELLSKFKWGDTFLNLNEELLNCYQNADNEQEILKIEKEYFPHL